MKKYLCLLLLLVITMCLFASQDNSLHIEVAPNYNLTYETAEVLGVKFDTILHSAGFSFEYGKKSNSGINLFNSLSFIFPISQKVGSNGVWINNNQFPTTLMMTSDLGLAFDITKNDFISFALGPYFRTFLFATFNPTSVFMNVYLGLGLILETQVNFSDNIYLSLGSKFGYNPLAFALISSSGNIVTDIGYITNLYLEPKLALGFRF